MTVPFAVVEEPQFGYQSHERPDPLSLMVDLPLVDQLQYLQHIVLAAVGPWAEMLEEPDGLPEPLVAEAAVLSGALMSMADSLAISHGRVDDLLEQLGIAVAQAEANAAGEGTAVADEEHNADAAEPNHEAAGAPFDQDAPKEATTDDGPGEPQ